MSERIRLNPFSLSVIRCSSQIFFYFIVPILIIFAIIFPFWYTRKQILKHDKSVWRTVRWQLLLSLMPLLFVLRYGMIILFTQSGFSSTPYVFKIILLLFCCVGLFAFCLWFKKVFKMQILKFLIKGLCIGYLSCALIIGLFIGIQEFLLRRDPAYIKMLKKIEEIEQRRIDQEAISTESPTLS